MVKRIVIAIVVVFVAWAVLDMVVHGGILRKTYEETSNLWRPMAEMKIGLMYLVTFVCAVSFVLAYALWVRPKSVARGLGFGLLWGIASGASMGFGSYSVMPIPIFMAVMWFTGMAAEMVVAGLVVGVIVKPPAPAAA